MRLRWRRSRLRRDRLSGDCIGRRRRDVDRVRAQWGRRRRTNVLFPRRNIHFSRIAGRSRRRMAVRGLGLSGGGRSVHRSGGGHVLAVLRGRCACGRNRQRHRRRVRRWNRWNRHLGSARGGDHWSLLLLGGRLRLAKRYRRPSVVGVRAVCRKRRQLGRSRKWLALGIEQLLQVCGRARLARFIACVGIGELVRQPVRRRRRRHGCNRGAPIVGGALVVAARLLETGSHREDG